MMGNSSHPFFDPLWRRVVLVAAIAAWSLTEFYFESTTWGMMVGIFAVYGVWSYLINYLPSTQVAAKTPPGAGASDGGEK